MAKLRSRIQFFLHTYTFIAENRAVTKARPETGGVHVLPSSLRKN